MSAPPPLRPGPAIAARGILSEMVLPWKRRRALRRIREGFALLGYDLDHVSDAELEEAMLEWGRKAEASGVTPKEPAREVARNSPAFRKEKARAQP